MTTAAKFTARKIRLSAWGPNESSDRRYECCFTPNGELLIRFRKSETWCNVNLLGEDIPEILDENGIPHITARSMRLRSGERDKQLSEIGSLI